MKNKFILLIFSLLLTGKSWGEPCPMPESKKIVTLDKDGYLDLIESLGICFSINYVNLSKYISEFYKTN